MKKILILSGDQDQEELIQLRNALLQMSNVTLICVDELQQMIQSMERMKIDNIEDHGKALLFNEPTPIKKLEHKIDLISMRDIGFMKSNRLGKGGKAQNRSKWKHQQKRR